VEWTSCKDGYPDIGRDIVLAYKEKGKAYWCAGRVEGGYTGMYVDTGEEMQEVTHDSYWALLPELPKDF
jgi:hypothetical protein